MLTNHDHDCNKNNVTDTALAEALFESTFTQDKELKKLAQTATLSEVSPRDESWTNRRRNVERVGNTFDKINDLIINRKTKSKKNFARLSKRVHGCTPHLYFGMSEDKLKLKRAFFCHCRHCEQCMSRKRLVRGKDTQDVFKNIFADNPDCRILFLTLTIQNPPIDELRDKLKWMNNAFKKMLKRKELENVVLGYTKSTEVTRPKKEITAKEAKALDKKLVTKKNGKYFILCPVESNTHCHPHFHIILIVKPSYFKKHYISHQKWREIWQDCLGVGYLPQVNIQVLKSHKRKDSDEVTTTEREEDISKVVRECVKYSAKSSDIIGDGSEEASIWTKIYVEEVDRMNFFVTGGLVKEYWKKLNKKETDDDISDKEMIHVDDDEETVEDDLRRWVFGWKGADYDGRGNYLFSRSYYKPPKDDDDG